MRTGLFCLAVAAVSLSGAGCDDEACEAGVAGECSCSGGGEGTRICREDGSRWGECQCTSSDGDADADLDADGDIDGVGDADQDASIDADTEDFQVILQGSVNKGPFVIGSRVAVSLVDGRGNPTGAVFLARTINDLGEFELELRVPRYASLDASGYYYNEVTGRLSDSPIRLLAFYEAESSGAQEANLNIITHLSYLRVRRLLLAGVDLGSATSQAEIELRLALEIGPSDFDPGEAGIGMSLLGGDTDANAYLLAVSAVLAQAAVLRDGPIDAELQEMVNMIAEDLAEDGSLDESTVRELREAEVALELDEVMDDLARRLHELDSMTDVPDLRRFIDSDSDGAVNANDCADRDPEIYPGAPEHCNARDDDCDGVTDNGFECARGESGECTTSFGTPGTRRCSARCTWGYCEAA